MANRRRGAKRYLPPSTPPSRLLNLLRIRELTRDRIGEEFCLMESVRRDVDRAKRRGRNSVIKPVRWKGFVVRPEPVRTSTSQHQRVEACGAPVEPGPPRTDLFRSSLACCPRNILAKSGKIGSPDEGAKRRNPGESSVSLDSASLHPGYILRGLFLGQYTRR